MNEMKKTAITLNVNSETYDIMTYPNQTLLEVLRDHLHLTGTKRVVAKGLWLLHSTSQRHPCPILPHTRDRRTRQRDHDH